MFFFNSAAKRARDQAGNLLLLAEKVDAYRRDVVDPAHLLAMRQAVIHLQTLRNRKAGAEELDQAAEELHAAMLPCGGDIYPVTFLGEHVDMVLVVGILIIGIRTFFLQPFQIPTNSMYPTYHGMTAYTYSIDEPSPGPVAKVWNLVTGGATHYTVLAPSDGEVLLPLDERGGLSYQPRNVRKWSRLWLTDSPERDYTVLVGGQPLVVPVSLDYDNSFDTMFLQVFAETYFPDVVKGVDPQQILAKLDQNGYVVRDEAGHAFIASGRTVHVGDRILDFDLRAGDMLFVDRFSYNFIAPKPGDPFVFHTGTITKLAKFLPPSPPPSDQYYIKRLVGVPGDQLEVRPPMLYRNGAPITGAPAFGKNNGQLDGYPGYTIGLNMTYLQQAITANQPIVVPPNQYFAMGDNSPTSLDSRFWGGVPAPNVVGRAIFIIYPFTSRWGPAQ
jgi:signal peptidase I